MKKYMVACAIALNSCSLVSAMDEVIAFCKATAGNAVKEPVVTFGKQDFRNLLKDIREEKRHPYCFTVRVTMGGTADTFKFKDNNAKLTNKLNYFCEVSESEYAVIGSKITDIDEQRSFVQNLIWILKEKCDKELSGNEETRKLSLKFGIIIKVSESLRSLAAPSLAYALLYQAKHEADDGRFQEKFVGMFPGYSDWTAYYRFEEAVYQVLLRNRTELRSNASVFDNHSRKIVKSRVIAWLNNNKNTANEKTNKIIGAITARPEARPYIKLISSDKRIEKGQLPDRDFTSTLIFASRYVGKSAAEEVREVSPDKLRENISGMLPYSPIYPAYKDLPGDLQVNLRVTFFSDQIATLKGITGEKEFVRKSHIFKTRVIFSYLPLFWSDSLEESDENQE